MGGRQSHESDPGEPSLGRTEEIEERIHQGNPEGRNYDPANIGKVMYDSLKIFNLGYGATIAEVRAQYRSMARMYHPDCHRLYREQTLMSDAEATEFFQMINNAHEYLKENFDAFSGSSFFSSLLATISK